MRFITPTRAIPAALILFAAGCASSEPANPSGECSCCVDEGEEAEAPLPPLYDCPELKRWRAAWEAYSGGRVVGEWTGDDLRYTLRPIPETGTKRELLCLRCDDGVPSDSLQLRISGTISPFSEANDIVSIAERIPDSKRDEEALPWRERLTLQAAELERRTELFSRRNEAALSAPVRIKSGETTLEACLRDLVAQIPEENRPVLAFLEGAPKGVSYTFTDDQSPPRTLRDTFRALQENYVGRLESWSWRLSGGFLLIESGKTGHGDAISNAMAREAELSLSRLRRELSTATRAEICIIKCREFEEHLREDASVSSVRENRFPLHPYGTEEPIVRRIAVPDADVRELAVLAGKSVDASGSGAFSHENPVGLRFWRGDTLLWETSLSFTSCNAQLPYPWPDARLGGAPSTHWRWAGLNGDAGELRKFIGRLAPDANAPAKEHAQKPEAP